MSSEHWETRYRHWKDRLSDDEYFFYDQLEKDFRGHGMAEWEARFAAHVYALEGKKPAVEAAGVM